MDMEVHSGIYNKYTGIIKEIELVNNPYFKEFFIVKSIVTDREQYDSLFLFDGIGAGCSTVFNIALMSSIGEAIERYCGNIYSNNYYEMSIREIQKSNEPYLPSDIFVRYDSSCYEEDSFPFKEMSDDDVVHWEYGTDLFSECKYLVPRSLIYVNYIDEKNKWNFPNLSGLASGTTQKMAIESAILEIVERDASIRWWYKNSKFRLVSQENSNQFEFTSFQIDSIVPTVATYLVDRNEKIVVIGFASRFDLSMAKEKSKAEAVQLHQNALNLLKNNVFEDDPVSKYLKPHRKDRKYSDSFRRDKKDMYDLIHNIQYCLDEHVYSKLTSKILRECQNKDSDLVAYNSEINSIDKLLSYLKGKNYKVIVKDLTSSDIQKMGWYVVRVLIPGFYLNAPTAYLPIEYSKIVRNLPIPHS